MELQAGPIVTVDWRKDPGDPDRDPHPPEPNKLRPAVVVQDCALFDLVYPTILVVPMTSDPELAIPDLSVVLQPSAIKTRITAATDSCVTSAELQQLRQLVVLAIGGLT